MTEQSPVSSQKFDEGLLEAHKHSPYGLGYFVEKQSEADAHQIKWDMKLSKEDFERYYASTVPYQRMTQRRPYQMLRQVTDNLRQTMQVYSNVYTFGGRYRGLDHTQVALAMTRAVTDWLNYSYIYLDTEKTFLTHLGAEEMATFEKATNDAYDTYPAYRFLYQLRNYAQHYGPPLATMEMSAAASGWDIALMLDKRELMGGTFGWNAKSRAVLDQQTNIFPVLPLIIEAMKGYELIEQRTLRIYLTYVESWLDVAEEILERLGPYQGRPYLFLASPDDSLRMIRFSKSLAGLPLMTQGYIDQVRWSLSQEDPVAAMWLEHDDDTGFVPDQRSVLQATQVMAAFYAGGPDAAELQITDILLSGVGAGYSLAIGLVNVTAVCLSELSQIFNAPPVSFLNIDHTTVCDD